MASFNGSDLGFIFTMSTSAAPKALQINAYAGADGLEVIDLGSRGGRTVVEGGLIAPNPGDLAAIEGAFRTLQVNALTSTLVDDLGTPWPGVKLLLFEPRGRVCAMADSAGFARKYHAEFLHLS